MQKISGLGLEVSKALADISERLTREVQLLASTREAVALEQKELERLRKFDVAATALDQMIQDYAREKQQLEAETAARRAAWEEESAGAERERKEQEESLWSGLRTGRRGRSEARRAAAELRHFPGAESGIRAQEPEMRLGWAAVSAFPTALQASGSA